MAAIIFGMDKFILCLGFGYSHRKEWTLAVLTSFLVKKIFVDLLSKPNKTQDLTTSACIFQSGFYNLIYKTIIAEYWIKQKQLRKTRLSIHWCAKRTWSWRIPNQALLT